MELVNVRMQVSKVTSANVSYLSKRLGISKQSTYALIVDLFIFERELDVAFLKLNDHLCMRPDTLPDDTPDDVPF